MSSKDWKFLFKLGVGVILLVFALGVVAYALGWIGSAGDVIKEEFGPEAALEKYEWFIDQANHIEKADKDIKLYEGRQTSVEEHYTDTYGSEKSKWLPSVQVQYNQESQTARDDLLAIASNRNGLVREYNAQSEKFNWAPFESRSDMPPHSYFEYVTK